MILLLMLLVLVLLHDIIPRHLQANLWHIMSSLLLLLLPPLLLWCIKLLGTWQVGGHHGAIHQLTCGTC
jgi:hypothetical protein